MIIGVDIGGSHISAAEILVNETGVSLGRRADDSVDTAKDAIDIIKDWVEVIRAVSLGSKDLQIGIAMPGPYDYENGISLISEQGKMKALYGLSVKKLLAESLCIPLNQISFTNDAEAFLKGEVFSGVGKGFTNTLGLTLGTGLGSAIHVDDVVKDAKLWTAPFREGIAEDYLGTAWFLEFVQMEFDLVIKGVKDLTSPDFDQNISSQVFEEFGKTLGEFLFPYVIRLQTQLVVLGGKISNASSLFLPSTIDYLKNNGVNLSLKKSSLGEDSALIGACEPFLKMIINLNEI
ncbi:ROK family protein [Algoriphagus sp. PAP.12]|uniref:ROK family protein n=1 Tax=Algoriphagus sp. PAP.12 TaxID=2996678 RepID=UPI00227A9E6C|nr:ROK family protein [Algoriphagus sp. PAP.12]